MSAGKSPNGKSSIGKSSGGSDDGGGLGAGAKGGQYSIHAEPDIYHGKNMVGLNPSIPMDPCLDLFYVAMKEIMNHDYLWASTRLSRIPNYEIQCQSPQIGNPNSLVAIPRERNFP